MRQLWRPFFLLISTMSLAFTSLPAQAVDTSWTSNCSIVPNCLGVSTHFTNYDQSIRDFPKMFNLGFRIVRTDMFWEWIEYKKGFLDFGNFDRTLFAMNQNGLRPMMILDNSNYHYGPITSQAAQNGFVNYARAAASRYKNYGTIWELWNEANTSHFWSPKPSPTQYMTLAKAVIPQMRSVDPKAIVVGPALLRKKPPTDSNVHMLETDFMASCFQQGFGNLFNAVSYHPYHMEEPSAPPEKMAADYQMMRQFIGTYGSSSMPLINSERGYNVSYLKNEEEHGNYMVRSYLVALMSNTPYFIYYMWRDENATSGEGVVNSSGAEKPAAKKLRMLTSSLMGFQYRSRLATKDTDYLLLFAKGKQYKVAAWTTSNSHTLLLYPGRTIQVSQSPAYYDYPTASIPKGKG